MGSDPKINMELIIVESPTKSRTISHFLGDDFEVVSCNGHIRDLPRGEVGIDIDEDFSPRYVIPTKKRKLVNQLKKIAEKAETIYYATDEDREGEAIAWHLAQILKSEHDKQKTIDHKQKFHRIGFHEITEEAVKNALKNPRDIDINLVNAQKSRRILDRLVGYKLSPLLWKKIVRGLSAGRVQSPAVRLIVEREKEIEKFRPEEYWTIVARFIKTLKHENIKTEFDPSPLAKGEGFEARLYKIDDKILDKLAIKSKRAADKIVEDLKKAVYKVARVQKKESQRHPYPPFTTSTLVQVANRNFGFSARQTMTLAQQLYEGVKLGEKGNLGLITYMRTDSLNLAEKFLAEAACFVKDEYGKKYSELRQYKTKAKVAQEAHEAIRSTSAARTPEKIKKYLDKNQYKLYELIWRRALASQMSSALLVSTQVDIIAKKYLFRASGTTIKFDGWLKLYPEKQTESILTPLEAGQKLLLVKLSPAQHFTEPPLRYTDASLVKTLEEYGIGRPSTYAPIIYTIQKRNYVEKLKGRFKPTEIGTLVNELLTTHFPKIVDYQFTARMEDNLDKIANGKKEWLVMIKNFYGPFKENLEKKEREISKSFTEEKTDEVCPKCGQPLVIKMGRFGKFLACSGFPECRYTKSLEGPEKIGLKCPKCNQGEVIKKRTKKGRFFYGCSRWPECDFASWTKPN